jgi:Double-GTPase 2
MSDCKLSTCTYAKDGVCVEGRKADCPNLLPDDSSKLPSAPSTDVLESSESSGALYPPTEALYSGLPLDIGEARELTGRARAIVVSLAGMTESGKTSLLARLHQQFLAGPVGLFNFAGSRTLWRFEELNWLATIESGVEAPIMDHTSRRYDNSLLHFTVRPLANGGDPVDLLLNDISGETFPEAVSEERVCQQLICLRRADHLALVVDGKAISDRARRHDHCAKAKNFVQRVLQTNQIGKQTVLHLVITKRDELLKEAQQAENLEAATRLETEFKEQFASQVAKLHSWQVAARPLDGTMPTEGTIAELFSTWVSSTFRYGSTGSDAGAAELSARDFCRFGS